MDWESFEERKCTNLEEKEFDVALNFEPGISVIKLELPNISHLNR